MVDLSVDIAGVKFPNPLIVGSSSLTNDAGKIQRLVEAGAGGIITKTISPDPLPGGPRRFSTGRFRQSLAVSADARLTTEQGAEVISAARAAADVPIIANVIGRSDDVDVWSTTCQTLESAGAGMIELDLNCHPEGGLELDVPEGLAYYDILSIGQDPEATARVVSAVCEAVAIPVASKLTLRAPDMLAVARASADAGAHVITGVNTLHSVADVDIEADGVPKLPGFATQPLSPICGPDLGLLGAKWTTLVCKYVDRPYISGSGITDLRDVIERIMLGAHATAICSTIYLNGPQIITETLSGLQEFLNRHGLGSCAEMRGRAATKVVERARDARQDVVARVTDPALWARVADDVYARSELECSCITRGSDGVILDETRCTGCALPAFHAPAAVEMVPAPR